MTRGVPVGVVGVVAAFNAPGWDSSMAGARVADHRVVSDASSARPPGRRKGPWRVGPARGVYCLGSREKMGL
jgi:hypothetical protein